MFGTSGRPESIASSPCATSPATTVTPACAAPFGIGPLAAAGACCVVAALRRRFGVSAGAFAGGGVCGCAAGWAGAASANIPPVGTYWLLAGGVGCVGGGVTGWAAAAAGGCWGGCCT